MQFACLQSLVKSYFSLSAVALLNCSAFFTTRQTNNMSAGLFSESSQSSGTKPWVAIPIVTPQTQVSSLYALNGSIDLAGDYGCIFANITSAIFGGIPAQPLNLSDCVVNFLASGLVFKPLNHLHHLQHLKVGNYFLFHLLFRLLLPHPQQFPAHRPRWAHPFLCHPVTAPQFLAYLLVHCCLPKHRTCKPVYS